MEQVIIFAEIIKREDKLKRNRLGDATITFSTTDSDTSFVGFFSA